MAVYANGVGFIGVRCKPEIEQELKRRARRRGWSVTTYVLTALDAAFAADEDRTAR